MATIQKNAPNIASAPATAPSFESALRELEGIVTAMEAGQMPLQESLDAYQRGVALLRQCQDTLTAAEQQVRILDATGLRDFAALEDAPRPEGNAGARTGGRNTGDALED